MKKLLLSLLLCLATLASYATLPDVTLRDTHGRNVSVASLAKSGKPVIIAFFATWCKPCMRELKALHELYDDWQDETGVEIILVSIDQGQDVQKVRPLVEGNGWEFRVLLDPNGTFKRAMNVQNVPHVFVLDSKGNIVYNHTGYSDGDERTLRKYLR